MKILRIIFPKTANNNYQGSKIAFYGLIPILFVYTFRSFVHFLKNDSGVNDIATIKIFNETNGLDPNIVIYMYSSLWGGVQVLLLIFCMIIFIRYKSLIPFLWIIIFLDYVFRLITTYLHPLTPEYYISRPPGGITNIYFLGYSIIMFLLSIRKRAKSL